VLILLVVIELSIGCKQKQKMAGTQSTGTCGSIVLCPLIPKEVDGMHLGRRTA
jgi:hypothetical protein